MSKRDEAVRVLAGWRSGSWAEVAAERLRALTRQGDMFAFEAAK